MMYKQNICSALSSIVIILLVLLAGAVNAQNEAVVTYEAFGAVGDGVQDDLAAICKAHEYANAQGLPVKSNPGATYHLGKKALTVIIATDTDWGTSRFTIDDTEVEDHKKSLFEIRSLLAPEKIKIDRLKRDQKQLDIQPGQDCFVQVTNNKLKRYIRRGLNQNSGTSQRDCFILRKDGTIVGDIDWDYQTIDGIEARPIDTKQLIVRGGVFTTIANRMKQDIGYNYWARNIKVTRSNTQIEGLTHYIVGETEVGHPYSGFININNCADIMLRNCFATGHRVYKTIGAAGKPVSMGSYDYSVSGVVNFSMIGCRMDHINDRSRWGVIGTNFCKNILLKDCILSRMDTHMGVSGSYVVSGCTLGYMGLNAIGRGRLTVEDSTLNGSSLINFRDDYGSTWEGNVVIRNCRWIPNDTGRNRLYLLNTNNDGMHDFGYTCFMPREVVIDGLTIDDSKQSKKYNELYFFSDPDGGKDIKEAKRLFPYEICQKLQVRGLTVTSGKKPGICPNASIEKSVELTWSEE
ncbi:MAG: hypothetical protein JXM68_03460 [Sedimentisphaerales bacterium]|nr:hypothetical protein [Sedimentisphaerales bacterium]